MNLKTMLTLAAASVLLISNTLMAQSEEAALLTDCLKAHADAFQPLEVKRKALYNKFANKSSAVRSIVRWIEDNPKSADSKRLDEIARLETLLAGMKSNAALTGAEALKDPETAIEDANVLIEDIDDERKTALRPIERERSKLTRSFKDQESKLEPVMEGLFRETGAGVKRKYASFSYANGSANATFQQEEKGPTVVTCYIYLVNTKPAKEKLGKAKDKYPIAYQSKNQIEILVGPTRVTAYSSNKDFNDKKLADTLFELVDLEKLETLATP
jgi:hypothetical protein